MGYRTIECPFCASTNISVPYEPNVGTYAECEDCDARGPIKVYLEEAIDAWNERWGG